MTETATDSSTRRILFLAPNWLGDAIMAAPVLSFLREVRLPGSEAAPRIVLGIRRAWAPLFADDPRVDEILLIERNGKHRGLGGIWRQAQAMRDTHSDAVLLGPPSLRAGLCASLSGIPIRIGYRGDTRRWTLTHALEKQPRGQQHYTSEAILLAERLIANWNGRVGSRWFDPTGQKDSPKFAASDYLPGCVDWPVWTDEASAAGPPIWAVAPGTTFGPAKTWPADRLREFLHLAVRDRGRRVVLLGDGSSAEFNRMLRSGLEVPWREEVPGPAGVVDLTGRTDFPRLVALLKAAEGFVGNDSGLMHLAGALGRPTVGIFGSSNPDWTRPGGAASNFVVADGFACRPCYKPTCTEPIFCLDTIRAQDVLHRLDQMMARTPVGGES